MMRLLAPVRPVMTAWLFVGWWLLGWMRAADPGATKPAEIVAAIAPSLVRLELELQYDKGEAPSGVFDHDPGSRTHSNHSLADVIREERPLEDTGYLVSPDTVVVPDATIHPRFIKSIRVASRSGSSEATVSAYGRDAWFMVLKLKERLPDVKPLEFVTGQKPAYLASYFRAEGGMLVDLAPFPGRYQQPDGRPGQRVLESSGLAVTTNGAPVGLVLSHRLAADDSWQGSPLSKPLVEAGALAADIQTLMAHSRQILPRVRLSFRSPKTSAGMERERFRGRSQGGDDENDDATEMDVLGLVLPGNKVAVMANLKASKTARLQRISIYPEGAAEGVTARFVASLKDHGVLVVEPEKPLPVTTRVYTGDLRDLLEVLVLKADIDLQGEVRADYFHGARFGMLRTGPRREAYPELGDMTGVAQAHLFTREGQAIALPVVRRERSGQRPGGRWNRGEVELTPARLLAAAVANLAATSDPANVPTSEADETRVAWLGVELQPLTRELARANGVSDQTRDGESGALVTYVHAESPAAKAGIGPGTVLLRVRAPGLPAPLEVQLEEDFMRAQPFPWDRMDEIREQFFDRLWTPWAPAENAFTRALTDLGFGTKYTLEYFVDGKLQTQEFEVVASPPHFDGAPRFKSESLGLTVRDLTYEVRRYMQRKADEPGVVISKLEPGSKASVSGLKPYEVVTHVNDQPVLTVKDFERLVAAGGELKFSVKRMAKGRIVTIKG